MMNIERVDGWKTSDGRIFKTEQEAIDNQQFINIRDAIVEIIYKSSHHLFDKSAARTAAYILAEQRQDLFKLLKDNV